MIRIKLDVMMAERKMSLNKLSELVGITPANLSILKNEKERQSALQHLMHFVKLWIASRVI